MADMEKEGKRRKAQETENKFSLLVELTANNLQSSIWHSFKESKQDV